MQFSQTYRFATLIGHKELMLSLGSAYFCIVNNSNT